ncbi:MAG: hypothetical protein LBT43_08915 [Prevotella sp.]|jgi:hypothetical protein|nr:hypothetical protein [Prevotella sp.]
MRKIIFILILLFSVSCDNNMEMTFKICPIATNGYEVIIPEGQIANVHIVMTDSIIDERRKTDISWIKRNYPQYVVGEWEWNKNDFFEPKKVTLDKRNTYYLSFSTTEVTGKSNKFFYYPSASHYLTDSIKKGATTITLTLAEFVNNNYEWINGIN